MLCNFLGLQAIFAQFCCDFAHRVFFVHILLISLCFCAFWVLFSKLKVVSVLFETFIIGRADLPYLYKKIVFISENTEASVENMYRV